MSSHTTPHEHTHHFRTSQILLLTEYSDEQANTPILRSRIMALVSRGVGPRVCQIFSLSKGNYVATRMYFLTYYETIAPNQEKGETRRSACTTSTLVAYLPVTFRGSRLSGKWKTWGAPWVPAGSIRGAQPRCWYQ